MASPFETLIEMQRQAFTGAQSFSRLWVSSWLRVVDQQRQMLDHMTRRTEDLGSGRPRAPKGADLQDHYGKRSRDVDVERI